MRALRTLFPRMQGVRVPAQQISERASCPALGRSFGSGSGRTGIAIQGLALQERTAHLDFERGPLMHARIIKISEVDHLLVLTMPSVCADTRSLHILGRDLNALYRGNEPTEELPIQYLQFSEWQFEVLESDDEDGEAGHAHWRKSAEEILPASRLPFEAEPGKDPLTLPRLSLQRSTRPRGPC